MSGTAQAQIRRRNDPRDTGVLRKSERTRRAILDAAVEFLWSHPFRELTVKELTAIAGTSRPAFYQYFADLHELMETLLHGMEGDIFEAAKPWFEGEGDPIPLLRETMTGLVKRCYQRGPILRAVADASSSDETLERAWAEFFKSFDDAVSQRIEQHQAAGLVPAFDAYGAYLVNELEDRYYRSLKNRDNMYYSGAQITPYIWHFTTHRGGAGSMEPPGKQGDYTNECLKGID